MSDNEHPDPPKDDGSVELMLSMLLGAAVLGSLIASIVFML
jgi:hypothetical protein